MYGVRRGGLTSGMALARCWSVSGGRATEVGVALTDLLAFSSQHRD